MWKYHFTIISTTPFNMVICSKFSVKMQNKNKLFKALLYVIFFFNLRRNLHE